MPQTLLSRTQVAERLGVSLVTAKRLTISGELAAVHVSPHVVRVRESDLERFIAARVSGADSKVEA